MFSKSAKEVAVIHKLTSVVCAIKSLGRRRMGIPWNEPDPTYAASMKVPALRLDGHVSQPLPLSSIREQRNTIFVQFPPPPLVSYILFLEGSSQTHIPHLSLALTQPPGP
ncbi:hypothetical protein KIL84_011628 [Mauremys mutica]|uniref:Uncharacterized protein n=1 Tax=Mauremys mutica TaxID=74926 RepID=A0A9D3XE18_9SAUR|nr:hypothetical protein KIL84_011628 [Mauremys mutica]